MGRQDDRQYFATLQGQEYLDALKDRINWYRDYVNTSGLATRWGISLGAYYGVSEDGKNSWRVTPGGEFGELIQFKVNEYASLIRHQLVLAVQQRPAGIAKAINTDTKTLRDARIGTQLVEYYFTDPAHNFEKDYVDALDRALKTAEAFIIQDWDPGLGPDMAADEEGQPIKSGDLVQKVCSTWNAARDLGAMNAESLPWYIFSDRINKFELCARYPAFTDQILTLSKTETGIRRPNFFRSTTDHTDFIEIHKLIHMPTEALKQGRYTVFTSEDVLLDSAYPYPVKNFHRITDQEIIDTVIAHTSNYDLLALEQMTDALHSIIGNNATTFGVNTIVGPKGGGVAQQELAKGLRYLEMDPALVDKIRPLNLAGTQPQIFEYNAALSVMKGQISGINSILRGDPQGMLKGASGSAMALLQSQAIMFNSGIQKAFYSILSKCGTGIIEMLREFVDEPRIAQIAGKANQQAIKEYKYDRKTLESVSTVVFEPINPVLQTAAGKAQVADNLLERGLITQPKRYIEVLTTGNLNVLLEDDVANEEAIIQENEELSEGKPVQAVITENHKDHIAGHQSVISMPNAKNDADLVQRVLIHIQQHVDLWNQASQQNPAMLAATGQQVLPPMPPPGMPPGGPPPGPSNSPPGNGSTAHPPPPGPKSTSLPQGPNTPSNGNQPNLPKPPINPATGERAPVADGTTVTH